MLFDHFDEIFSHAEVTWTNNLAKNEVELGVSLDGDVAWVKNGQGLSQFV